MNIFHRIFGPLIRKEAERLAARELLKRVTGRIAYEFYDARTFPTELYLREKRPMEHERFMDMLSGAKLLHASSWTRNLFVTAGYGYLFKKAQFGHAINVASEGIRYIGVGTGLNVPALTDSALQTETARKEIDSWDNTSIDSNPNITIASVLFLESEANANLFEQGLFIAATAGTMVARANYKTGNITGATQANPVVITDVAHGLVTGDTIRIRNVGGMTQINDRNFTVTVLTADTFELQGENGTGHTAYTSGGDWLQYAAKNSGVVMRAKHELKFTP